MKLLVNILDAIEWLGRRLGEVTSWLILGTLATVLVAVVAGALGANEMLIWGVPLPLLGEKLTINGIFDLEWHFFALMVMVGGTYAYQDDSHVRSDLFYGNFSERKKRWIDQLGDVFLLLPFSVVMTWLSWGFVVRAYNAGEKSDYGGLVDRFLIKSVIPLGFALLSVVVLSRVVRRLLPPSENAVAPGRSQK